MQNKGWFPNTRLCGRAVSHHLSQIITCYLLSPRGTVVVVIAGVVVVATVVVVGIVVVGAAVVVGGGGGAVAGVGNRRCQKGKVDQGSTGFTLTLCNSPSPTISSLMVFSTSVEKRFWWATLLPHRCQTRCSNGDLCWLHRCLNHYCWNISVRTKTKNKQVANCTCENDTS